MKEPQKNKAIAITSPFEENKDDCKSVLPWIRGIERKENNGKKVLRG